MIIHSCPLPVRGSPKVVGEYRQTRRWFNGVYVFEFITVDVAIAHTLETHGLTLKAIAGIMKSIRKEVRHLVKTIRKDTKDKPQYLKHHYRFQ